MTTTADERGHLTLFCDRCGAEFVTTELVRECPHCAPIGGVQ